MKPVPRIDARGAMRVAPCALFLALAVLVAVASAQIRIGIGMPRLDVDIGYNVPAYPELQLVPGYPVYYAPGMDANYFFYDGMFWIFQGDSWYSSAWYNGPWQQVGPDEVPDYLLRVPVGYYVRPPRYFGQWQRDAPPRWGEHWGAAWAQQRRNWDRWDRRSVPAAAAPPAYQRQYSGARYPRAEEQGALRRQQDHYQPQDPAVRRVLDAQQRAPERQRPPSSGAAAPPQRQADRFRAPPNAAAPEAARAQGQGNTRSEPGAAAPSPQQRGQEYERPPTVAGTAPMQQHGQGNPRPAPAMPQAAALQRGQGEPGSAPDGAPPRPPQRSAPEAVRAPQPQQRPQEQAPQRPAGPASAQGREADGRGDERR